MNILIINGPNLNFLGIREPNIYNSSTYDDLKAYLNQYATKNNINLEIFQSNYEGAIIDELQKAYFEKVGNKKTVLYGPAYKGIPIAVSVAVALAKDGLDVPFFFNRKEEKDHGADKGSFLGSKLKDGDRVVMIEDVTTSGKSMEETVPKVRGAADVTIVGLMVSLNRMEKGLGGEKSALEEIREKYGFETNAIVTMEEVVEHLYNRTCQGRVVIDDTIKAAIDDYYKQYGCN